MLIVLEWLHPGCDSDLSEDFHNFGANNFPFKIPFKKCFKIVFLSLWRREPGFGAAISDAVPCSSIVFCNSVSADRIVVAASRLLGAAAACVILLSFATRSRKSYWSGCIQAAIVICQQIFAILAPLIKNPFKNASKSVFLLWRREPVLELLLPTLFRVVLLCFATQSLQIALYWLRQGCLAQRLHA